MNKSRPSCINRVGENLKCPSCNGFSIKYGVSSAQKQRYFCKLCSKTFLQFYTRQSYCSKINPEIIGLLKEGVGISGLSRHLKIAKTTVLRRIITIAEQLRRWNIDPKRRYEESDYSVFGGNPIRNSDILGDKWATANDKKKADIISAKLAKREQAYKESYEKNMKKLEAAEASGDQKKIDKYSKLADHAQEGKFEMALAQSELVAMGYDQKITFSFTEWDNTRNAQFYTWDGTPDQPVGKIPYDPDGHFGQTAHELKHAAQHLFGFSTPAFATGDKRKFESEAGDEREGYVRQYFSEPVMYQIRC